MVINRCKLWVLLVYIYLVLVPVCLIMFVISEIFPKLGDQLFDILSDHTTGLRLKIDEIVKEMGYEPTDFS